MKKRPATYKDKMLHLLTNCATKIAKKTKNQNKKSVIATDCPLQLAGLFQG
jgi:hypothetical protein